YVQRSARPVGREAITRVLLEAFHKMPRYRATSGIVAEKMFDDMLKSMGEAVTELDPLLQNSVRRRAIWSAMPLARCLLLARFVGLGIEQLFDRAELLPNSDVLRGKVEWATDEIDSIRKANPHFTRE